MGMTGKHDLRQRMASFLELPQDVMLDVARITLIGAMEVLVENHRGLHHYTPDKVVLGVPDGRLSIAGEEMQIGAISPEQVVLVGKIREIRYQD